jgi:nitroreductase
MKYFSKPVQDLIKSRKSVRSYDNQPLSEDMKKKITDYFETIESPLKNEIRIVFVDKDSDAEKGIKIGTYGLIKGAKTFIAAIIPSDAIASYVQLGFKLEQLILYAKDLGLGTVWLGGTFNKDQFTKAADLAQHEIMPIVTPIGFPADKRSLTEVLMRKTSSGDKRKGWEEMFFDRAFNKPLLRSDAGKYEPALEMVRLAPSAANIQPWRIIKEYDKFHFYNSKSNAKMHDIDIGICMSHFELTLNEAEIKGSWKIQKPEIKKLPKNYDYIITWCAE